VAPNGNKDPVGFDGMADAEDERRLKVNFLILSPLFQVKKVQMSHAYYSSVKSKMHAA
jgi:hypothetical protein